MLAKLDCDKVSKREMFVLEQFLRDIFSPIQLVCSILSLFLPPLQDNVLNIINQIMDECIPNDRANRDFSVKFPEEIRHDNLAGQLWFGAEVVHENNHD